MHLLGTAISFWFSTIIEESMEGYISKAKISYSEQMELNKSSAILLRNVVEHHIYCSNRTLADVESLDYLPYLHPFSIELNIILASVWFVVWTNVGKSAESETKTGLILELGNKEAHSELHRVQEEISEDRNTGAIDVSYRSNISINIDLHASNIGFFCGLLMLLIIIISTILFFTTIKKESYRDVGIYIYTVQFGLLTLCSLIATPMAFWKTSGLNVVRVAHMDNSTTAMDDLLLVLPLPFYFVHHLLSIYAELNNGSANSIIMSIIYLMQFVQITFQTPFIIDGLRRCSNENHLRYKKPGKGLVTFSLIINVTLWILKTFEIKSVDKYHSMPQYFGMFVWMVILDTCLPLMLFYRFHSSVCLSQIWKNAYEKD